LGKIADQEQGVAREAEKPGGNKAPGSEIDPRQSRPLGKRTGEKTGQARIHERRKTQYMQKTHITLWVNGRGCRRKIFVPVEKARFGTKSYSNGARELRLAIVRTDFKGCGNNKEKTSHNFLLKKFRNLGGSRTKKLRMGCLELHEKRPMNNNGRGPNIRKKNKDQSHFNVR